MGKFCKNCGRPLQEGEVCNCIQEESEKATKNIQEKQEKSNYNRRTDQQSMKQNIQTPNYTENNRTDKINIPTLLVPIGQTVVGGILVIIGLITGTYDWSFISYVSGAGFLLTGICGMISSKEK